MEFLIFHMKMVEEKINLHSHEIEDRTSGIPKVKTTTPWFPSKKKWTKNTDAHVIYSSETETDSATRGCVRICPCIVMVKWLRILNTSTFVFMIKGGRVWMVKESYWMKWLEFIYRLNDYVRLNKLNLNNKDLSLCEYLFWRRGGG